MRILTLFKILPVVFAVVVCAAFVSVYQAVEKERDIISTQAAIRQLSVDMMSASDYLTDQSRAYVVTGDIKYYNNYVDESINVKRRENAVTQLVGFGVPKEERELLSDAKLQSSGLQGIEKLAFEYVESGDLETAQNIIFGDVYYREKEPIKNLLAQFQSVLDKRCAYEISLAQRQALISIIIAFLSMIPTIVIIFINCSLISTKEKVINYTVESLSKIIDGDFNVEIDMKKEKVNGEIGAMSSNLVRLTETIYKVKSEVNELLNEAAAGNLSKRADVSRFDGEWENVLVQLNKLLTVTLDKSKTTEK